MPTFGDFGYYFAIDVLKISKEFLCIVPVLGSVFCVLNPLLYQKLFSRAEYRTLFLIA